MSDATEIQVLVKGIGPLMKWFSENRLNPHAHRLHVKREHWTLLQRRRDLATLNGFVVDGERIWYRGFELLPTDCGARHSRERGPCQ